MRGYTELVREALRALAEPHTHVLVQAGVGGLAAAVAGHLADALGDAWPRLVVVETTRAAGDGELRAAIGLDNRSHVLAINTEGAIDRARYREIVGK